MESVDGCLISATIPTEQPVWSLPHSCSLEEVPGCAAWCPIDQCNGSVKRNIHLL